MMEKLLTGKKLEKKLTLRTDANTAKASTPTMEKKQKKVIELPLKVFLIGFMGSGKSHWGRIWAT